MNALTFSAKRLLPAAFVFLGLGLTAQAQIGSIPALTADYQVPGSTITASSRNTGTDALIFNAGPYTGQNLQVMTWDASSGSGGTIALSWSIQNGTAPPSTAGIQNLNRLAANDPDVVVAQNEAGVWVNLVYTQVVNSKARTMYEVHKWNGAGFTQVGSTLPLGDPLYDHLSPNIDANAEGLIGIVWQQRRTVTAQVSVTSPLAEFSPFGYTQTYTFDRSYLVTGNITGGLNFCNYNNGAAGAPVANPSQLVEQTLQPDVAVSPGDNTNAIVSVSYVRHYVNNDVNDPTYGIKDQLVVRQFAYGQCTDVPTIALVPTGTPSSFSWDLPGLNKDLAPRIAATNSTFRSDVEVALAWIPGVGCGGGVPTYEIRNYGKSQGTFRPVSTVNPLIVIGLTHSSLPVRG